MSNFDDVNAFLNSAGGKAFAFENFGDACEGEILAMEKRAQTDPKNGVVKTFDDGTPMMMLVITLQTLLNDDENDDGVRTIYAKGGKFDPVKGSGTSMITAIRDAVKKAGTGIEVGGYLAVTYTGEGKASAKGFNAPKLYSATYRAAVRSVSVDELA